MNNPLRILIIDDNPDDRALLIREMKREFSNLQAREIIHAEGFAEALESGDFDLVVTDYHLHFTDGLSVLRAIKARWPDRPVIMFTGTGNEEVAVAAMKAGLDDYVLKSPRHYVRVPAAVRLALDRAQQRQAAKAAETRYEALFNGVPVGLYRSGPDGQIMDANPAFIQMMGCTDEKALMTISAADLYVDVKDHERCLDRLTRAGFVRDFETRLRRRDGAVIWAKVDARAVQDEEGALLYYEGSVEDITERKRSEEALTLAAEQWRNTFDAIGALVAIIDRRSRVVRANQAMRDAFHCAELVGAPCYKLFHGADAPLPECPAYRTFRSGEAEHAELCEQHLGGRWFDVSTYPIRDKDGAVQQAVHIVRDITERKQAEREMRELLQLHQNTIATIPSSLLVLDADLNVVMVNRRYLEGRGGSLSDVVDHNIRDVFPPALLEDQSLLERIRAVAERGGYDELLGVKHTSSAHADKYLDIRICGIRSESEEQETRVLLIIDDVTRQRTLEEQLRQAAKMESVGKLAGGVAHDFNNILMGIIGHAQIAIQELPEGEPVAQTLRQIRELSNRAATLTRQLLAFSRKQTLEPVPLSVNALVENISKMLQRLIGEDIYLEFIPAHDLGVVQADPGQIEQVLMNLAVNARDAMPQGGKLTIETTNVTLDDEYAAKHVDVAPGLYIMVAVTDTGCGMDRETLEHIFEPFFTTKAVGKGTGLGLSTVHGIVKQHGGSIWAYSEKGDGTTFKIYLPRVSLAIEEQTKKPEEPRGPRGVETILVVEDEQVVRNTAELILERQGYTVLTAACAADAEEVFAQHGEEVALLLTDVVMPGGNGPDLYERLTSKKPSLKVLYISGYADNAIVHNGVLERDTAFMQKPFTPSALSRKVREVLDRET